MRVYSYVAHTQVANGRIVSVGNRSSNTPDAYIAEYCDGNMPLDTPTRHAWCPFCNKDVSARGFIVWRTHTGWSMFCHKCGVSRRFKRDGVASPSTLISRVNGIRSPLNRKGGSAYLPEDFVLDLPGAAKQWLRKYGVTDAEAKRYRFGYSERMNRLIMPVFKDGEVVYWQGRRLSGNRHEMKYLSMRGATKDSFFELITPGATNAVLVEDIVSAIVLRRAGYNAISLLGSYIGDAAASRLKSLGLTSVCVWLDPDKRKESVKFARKLSGLGFSATCLVTPTKDPKDYSITQIRAHLSKGGFPHEEDRQIHMG